MYTYIVKKLQTVLASAVAVVTSANECVAGGEVSCPRLPCLTLMTPERVPGQNCSIVQQTALTRGRADRFSNCPIYPVATTQTHTEPS